LNRGVTPAESGSSVSSGQQQGGDSAAGTDGDETSDDENGDASTDGEDGTVATPVTPRPPPSGIRRSILVAPPDGRLIIYSSDELFEYIEGDIEWFFVYTGQGDAELEIAYTSVTTQQGIAAHAETFLNEFTSSTAAVYSGEEYIQGSSLMGYHVSARTGRGTYEAWLHDLAGSDLILVFVIFYENDMQKEALYTVLSSMDME